jgi:Tfp pilus assembly protein PilO
VRNLTVIKQRFIVALVIMAIVDVALITYLMWPGSSLSALETERAALQSKYSALRGEVKPLEQMDVKLAQTRSNITDLYKETIPRRSSQIAQELDRLKKAAGVKTQSIHYTDVKSDKGDLAEVQRVNIETTVTGDYTQVARFINALEQSQLLFIIEQISLSGLEGGTVNLQIKFQTFLKETA